MAWTRERGEPLYRQSIIDLTRPQRDLNSTLVGRDNQSGNIIVMEEANTGQEKEIETKKYTENEEVVNKYSMEINRLVLLSQV